MAIEPDPGNAGSSYARVDRYLTFDSVVPQQDGSGRQFEAVLRAASPASAVPRSRPVNSAIVVRGLRCNHPCRSARNFDPNNAIRLQLDESSCDLETTALLHAPLEVKEREIRAILLNRKIRDAAFRDAACSAYHDTCAVSGLKIVNGGGRSEVQAAHVWSVEDGGPDAVQNGIALSGTIHWLFDRHLISLSDEYRLLVSHNKVPAELQSLFANQLERIRLPRRRSDWPHPAYLRRHREAAML